MTKTIAQHELRNQNAKIVDAVEAGETFIVTRNGEPVAELRPLTRGRRTLVPKDDVLRLSHAVVQIDAEQFRADLDRAVDQELWR